MSAILTSVRNTDSTHFSPWDEAKPEDNVFDLEVEVLLLDRSVDDDDGGNVSLRIDALVGRTSKSVCAKWDVDVKDDDSAKPVVEVKVETDIPDGGDGMLTVDDEFRVSVSAQHRMPEREERGGGEGGGGSVNLTLPTSTAEAKALKLGFYLPP